MRVLTKVGILRRLMLDVGLTEEEMKGVVDDYFEAIAQALTRGENVKLSGFGNYYLPDRKERMGRNPRTGEPACISARRVVKFKPAQRLKEKIAAYRPAENEEDVKF